MGGFRNAQNNKLQRKMWAARTTYKQPASATEIDAYTGKEKSCKTFTVITAAKLSTFVRSFNIGVPAVE